MKKFMIAIAILLVTASFSGCLSQLGLGGGTSSPSVGTGYPGVEFVDFYAVNKKVPKNSDVVLYYSIQNNGYFDAVNTKVTLYNCGDINKGTHTWSVSTDVEGYTYTCNTPVASPGSTLRMPDRTQGVSGEIADAEVSLNTQKANIPVGDSPHTFSARVEYDYMTTAVRDVVFTTFDNWKEKGGNIQTGALLSSSKPAPIAVSINAPDQPIIITKDSKGNDQEQEFAVAVQIRNTGGGYLKDKMLNKIELCYDPALVTVKDAKDFPVKGGPAPVYGDTCYLAYDDTEWKKQNAGKECLCLSQQGTTSKLNMVGLTNQWRDVSAIFSPVIDADKTPKQAAVSVQDITNFAATVEYTYMNDKSTQLTLTRAK